MSHYQLAPAAGAPDWLAGGGGGGGGSGGGGGGEKSAEAELGALLALLGDESTEREVRDDGSATGLIWGLQIITVYSFSRHFHPRLVAMETSGGSMNAMSVNGRFP